MTGPAPLSLRRNLDPRTWPTWEVVRPALFRLNRLTVAARPIPRSNVRVSAYSVWRLKNRDIMQDFVADLGPETAIHLHCLDTPPADGELAELTDSDGPGDRIPLLASLMADHPPRPGDWVLLFDDDAYFRPGDWSSFVAVAEQAGFDICQPSHDQASHFSHPMTRARFFSLARRTDFVEVGPIVLLSPAAARACLPFPADVVMGWGLDVLWWSLGQQELVLGLVDATPIMHTGSVGGAYSRTEETEVLDRYLQRFGVDELKDIITETGETWRPWQRRPGWR